MMFFTSLISYNALLVTPGRTVCTTQACYVGGQLETGAGGSYSSFQGIR